MTTETDPLIYGDLAAVMADVTAVGKDGRNESQGYRFRGIDGVLNAVGPALRAHRVIVMPEMLEMTDEVVEVGKNRSRMSRVTVRVRYSFIASDGSMLHAVVPGEALDSSDKAGSKAMSVAFRTVLIQALALPTDEPDPDASSYERSEPPPPMTSSQQSDIADALADLDESAAAVVRSWWKSEGLPRMDRLTEAQANTVLSHLGRTTEASS